MAPQGPVLSLGLMTGLAPSSDQTSQGAEPGKCQPKKVGTFLDSVGFMKHLQMCLLQCLVVIWYKQDGLCMFLTVVLFIDNPTSYYLMEQSEVRLKVGRYYDLEPLTKRVDGACWLGWGRTA